MYIGIEHPYPCARSAVPRREFLVGLGGEFIVCCEGEWGLLGWGGGLWVRGVHNGRYGEWVCLLQGGRVAERGQVARVAFGYGGCSPSWGQHGLDTDIVLVVSDDGEPAVEDVGDQGGDGDVATHDGVLFEEHV
jgi:hypothetical protein